MDDHGDEPRTELEDALHGAVLDLDDLQQMARDSDAPAVSRGLARESLARAGVLVRRAARHLGVTLEGVGGEGGAE